MTAAVAPSQPKIPAARQHSALPWELSPQGYIIPTHKSPMAMLKLKSPWVEGAWDDDPEADANAAFIVEAVNSHASLKARIEELEAALRGLTDCVDGLSFAERDVILAVGRTNWSVMRHWISEARAALQKEPGE